MPLSRATLDGNEAVARVAYACSEVIAIYPITPSSGMGELADQWATEGRANLWGCVPRVIEMQSEGGAAGTLHGAIQGGTLGTTFTASQGILLMIPNLYKIAGELTPCVIHVASRAIAAQGLSIFGDHQDVMACRPTGCMLLASGSVQEAADLAAIAHAATLEARLPVIHFFDGFRTSHEIATITPPEADDLRAILDDNAVTAHRNRSLSPERPVIRGTAQNPDVYFQGRESVNPYYNAAPHIVREVMKRFGDRTGRHYDLFDYIGATDAERVIIQMGSGTGASEETVAALNRLGEKVGLLKVRLYRPFDVAAFSQSLPLTVKAVAVLDRTKEPGSIGEPLYLDVIAALRETGRGNIRVVGGRYGLGSKEFTPAMAAAVYANLAADQPRNHFTLGIVDDVSQTDLPPVAGFDTEDPDCIRAIFFGLGSDGTVSANKNSIKIIGEQTRLHAQGYFVYDSKKSGSVTVSHLRFGPNPIRSTYLISRAEFVACHQLTLLDRVDVLSRAADCATFLLNSPYGPDEVWQQLPGKVRKRIREKRLKFFVIDASRVAAELGMTGRINTIMQTCFFALSGILPRQEAIAEIKKAIEKTYGKRGRPVVERNWAAVDAAVAALFPVSIPTTDSSAAEEPRPIVPPEAPEFVRRVTSLMMIGEGDRLPVSALPADGTWPSGTSRWEKRSIASEVPVWDESICIQCGKCVLVCPHAVIRGKIYDPTALTDAPPGFKHAAARWPDRKNLAYTLQISIDDCTGCRVCVEACPVKNKIDPKRKAINMQPIRPLLEPERANWKFFETLPDPHREHIRTDSVKDVQLLRPLFEFSGACAGCGETPYLKLLSQLFGDRAIIANATGCSSIYGGNLPTTPWAAGPDGRGPAWSNSLFEDNAEFGLGFRLAADQLQRIAHDLLHQLRPQIAGELVNELLTADQSSDAGIRLQRQRVEELTRHLQTLDDPRARQLLAIRDALIRRSVWLVGGDGWAYDIGYGGLDHVLNSGADVNILVLDTEVYSNTGGQMSKATPLAAVAKFASGGKPAPKKDLGLIAITQGHCYVARVAFGANDQQLLTAFREAESFPGPSLILAYSPCIAHGYDLARNLDQQKAAVQSGYWPLYRYDPRRRAAGENPFQLDCQPPSLSLKSFAYAETRFTVLAQTNPTVAAALLHDAERELRERWQFYTLLADMPAPLMRNGKPPS